MEGSATNNCCCLDNYSCKTTKAKQLNRKIASQIELFVDLAPTSAVSFKEIKIQIVQGLTNTIQYCRLQITMTPYSVK